MSVWLFSVAIAQQAAAPPQPSSSAPQSYVASLEPGTVDLEQVRDSIPVSRGNAFGIVGLMHVPGGFELNLGRNSAAASKRTEGTVEFSDVGQATYRPAGDDGEFLPIAADVTCRLLFDPDRILRFNGCALPIEDPGFKKPVPPSLIALDRKALRTYRAGAVIGGLGVGTEVLGLVLRNGTLITAGTIGEVVGAPLMAGGSLSSRRVLKEMGAEVTAVPGTLSWVFWAGGFGFGTAAALSDQDTSLPLAIAGLGCRVGAYAAAGGQHAANKRARRELGVVATTEPRLRRRFAVGLAPYAGSAPGLTVTLVER